ncbi:SRPBCC family protein [Profundibacterium mesophilum]|uniref:Integral membrane protein n=1 Tax=Profundibacterium mesophilum KAUST100406-0324 TaxID=1037889 RepID=A0A921NWW4_9RHOB|nr:SRPBCC family protein [Profundibacterium mesophilum]KAF0677163.1 putative integral membrane protein [Profundibacterium mesophilum KAUST100406-0324]
MYSDNDDPRFLPSPYGAPRRYDEGSYRPDRGTTAVVLGLGVLAGAAGYAWYQAATRNRVGHRPPDDAPGRTSRQSRYGNYAVTGRTVTINKPRAELYRFWRSFQNLPQFMENLHDVREVGDVTEWTIRAPLDREVTVRTRIVQDVEGEMISWRSIEGSDIDTEGKVTFRDAPADRGTEVEAIIAYVPPAGELGRWVAKAFQAEPAIQGRRELRRLKMLMETGEIATNANRKTA